MGSVPIRPEGLPSTRNLMFEFPRILTFPSASTVTEGILLKTSVAVPPCETILFSTLKTFLSIDVSIKSFSAVTSITSVVVIFAINVIVPAS